MYREIEKSLLKWIKSSSRKPIIFKGARQVGKSYVVKNYLAKYFESFVEVNFEKNPEIKEIFQPSLEPQQIIKRLEIRLNKKIDIGKTLIFFDEVQLCAECITSLRYFYEDLPEQHVIAAGSLIDFVLDKVSIPVGRVEYYNMFPLSFEEFVINLKRENFLHEIAANFPGPYSTTIHNLGMSLVRDYSMIGGMPAAADLFVTQEKTLEALNIQKQILATYNDDIAKYSKQRKEFLNLQFMMERAPHFALKPFKFVDISRDLSAQNIRESIDLLHKAQILQYIFSTASLPPSKYYKVGRYKFLFLDIGLLQQATKFKASRWLSESLVLLNDGNIAEQFVGQQILASAAPERDNLYYWERENKSSSAEVDFLLQVGDTAIPIEVKSVAAGRLNSLRVFLDTYKEVKFGLRVCGMNTKIDNKLLSIPHYVLPEFLRKVKSDGVAGIQRIIDK